MSPINYDSIIVEDDSGNPYVTIEGQGKWEGLKACGTKEKLAIGEDPDCAPLTTAESCFEFDSSTGTITGYDLDTCPSEVGIPSKIGGVTVEHIGQASFILPTYQYCFVGELVLYNGIDVGLNYVHTESDSYSDCRFYTSTNPNPITKIYFPNTVKTIGTSAFTGNNLTNVVIPNSVTYIGDSAFFSNKLSHVTISNSMSTINRGVFCNNLLTNITIPENITNIRGYAFNNNQLISVYIGPNIENIEFSPFGGNPTLTSIVVDASNPNYKSVNDAIYTKDGTSIITGIASTANNIESTTVAIESGAFEGINLSSIIIPNNITTIKNGAFVTNQLTNITIPNSVTTIGVGAFNGNDLTNITIPSSVNNIDSYAFLNNKLTSITMGKAGTTIGNYLLINNNNFRTAYQAGGAGTYTGTQEGTWTKQ